MLTFDCQISYQANDNAALKPLTDDLSQVVAKDSSVSVSRQFSISELISPVAFPVSHYSTYSGSLTTPTCNEVVFWINFLTPLKISDSQLKNIYDTIVQETEPDRYMHESKIKEKRDQMIAY